MLVITSACMVFVLCIFSLLTFQRRVDGLDKNHDSKE
jgi:hypothetical protein